VQGVRAMSRNAIEREERIIFSWKTQKLKIENQKIAKRQNTKSKKQKFCGKLRDWENGLRKQRRSIFSIHL
jgi:hypothetical protein